MNLAVSKKGIRGEHVHASLPLKPQDPSPPLSARSDSSKSNTSSPLLARKHSSSGDSDQRDDLSEYYSVASLTHRSRDATDATANDETFVSVRSRASLEDALWSDDEGPIDPTDNSASADVDPSARDSMRRLAASQECRLLLARGCDLQRRGGAAAEACRAFALALEAARALGDAGLQASPPPHPPRLHLSPPVFLSDDET